MLGRSRSWVAEEGEVFRKGTVLLGPEELEGEYDGEELRKEVRHRGLFSLFKLYTHLIPRKQLLEAMVERPPPRTIDEFGMDGLLAPELESDPFSVPLSPPPPSVGSPTVQSPTFGFSGNNGPTSPTEQQQPTKPPPRPYIPRRSSASTTSSIMGVISPTIGASASPSLAQTSSPVVGGGSGSGNGNGNDGSPHALAHLPMFVKRTRSVDSSGSGSTVG